MPFFLLFVGIIMLMAAINDRSKDLGDLWLSQLAGPSGTGKGSFLNLVFVFLLVSALGAITNLRPLATAFMGLIMLALVLGGSGTTQSTSLIARFRAQMLGGN